MSCASWGKGGTDTQVYLDLHDLDLCEKLCYLSLIFPFPYVHNIMNLLSWNFHVLFWYTWQRSISHFCTWWPWPCTDWPQNWSVLITEDIKTSFTWSLPQSYSCSRNMKDITCSLKKTDTSLLSLTFTLHWLTPNFTRILYFPWHPSIPHTMHLHTFPSLGSCPQTHTWQHPPAIL